MAISKMSKYNTNLASEFWVLSTLHRLGAEAYLTLGNKKSVDIVVQPDEGSIRTIDVKGVAKHYDWPADNIKLPGKQNHYYVLVCFDGKIDQPDQSPSAWVVPAKELKDFIKTYKTRKVVSRMLMKKNGARFWQSWHLISCSESATVQSS
jgi:hypothetical protein